MINILKKKKSFIIGLNSGTSADGLDMAVVMIDRSRKSYNCKFVYGSEKKFPLSLRNKIIELADNPNPPLDEIIYLDNLLGLFFSKSVDSYIKSLHKKNIFVDAVASHGQTIRHLPKKVSRGNKRINGTLQIGSADYIAQETQLPVVSDFRQADIASGGEGAPITAGAMSKIFSDSDSAKLIINIGGMSNYFFIPSDDSSDNIIAQDSGPGNVLSDLLMRQMFNSEYDKQGTIARSGVISKRLLTLLTAKSFASDKEKSTGRERFGSNTAQLILQYAQKMKLSKADIMATSLEFTAFSIFQSLNRLIINKKIEKLYLTGGGRKNIFLVERLQSYFQKCKIFQIDSEGINGDFVEACAYAVMGEATLRAESVQGSHSKRINPVFGKITLPPVTR